MKFTIFVALEASLAFVAPYSGIAQVAPVTLTCDDATAFTFIIGMNAQHLTLLRDGASVAAMQAKSAASGISYEGNGWVLRGKGDEHLITAPDGRTYRCSTKK